MAEGHVGNATNSMVKRSESVSKIQLLNQALNAASSSLNQAKQLISDIERRGGAPEMPGLVGKYDGMFMVTEAGKKYPVPDNYSAKTKLVYGDKLKMVEGPEGRRFKLLEEMEREEQEAQLAVKDGRFEALSKNESYHLIQGAVRYWGGEEGDKIKILLPKGGKNIPFAGLLEIIGRKPGEGEPPRASLAEGGSEKPLEKPVERPAEKSALLVGRPGKREDWFKTDLGPRPISLRTNPRDEKKVSPVEPAKKEEGKLSESLPGRQAGTYLSAEAGKAKVEAKREGGSAKKEEEKLVVKASASAADKFAKKEEPAKKSEKSPDEEELR